MQDEKLIECVRIREYLYDTKHAKYMDAKYKAIAWKEIAEEMNQPPALCKSRWQNIRDQFRKSRARNIALRNGQAADSPGYKTHKFRQSLDFLMPFFQERDMLTSVRVSMGTSSSHATTTADSNTDTVDNNTDTVCNNTDTVAVEESDEADEDRPPRKKKKGEFADLINSIDECNEIIKSLVRDDQTDTQLFFKSLALTVSRLDLHRRLIAKRKMLEIVTELEESQLRSDCGRLS